MKVSISIEVFTFISPTQKGKLVDTFFCPTS